MHPLRYESSTRNTIVDCKKLQIYRHRDMIAIQGDGVPTFYLNSAMCHMLAKNLQDGVVSLLTEKKFSESNFPDTTLQTN